MTELLERAFEILGRMPPDAQDDIAEALLGMAEVIELTDVESEHHAAIVEGMAQATRGEFASGSASDIVAEAFRRHRR